MPQRMPKTNPNPYGIPPQSPGFTPMSMNAPGYPHHLTSDPAYERRGFTPSYPRRFDLGDTVQIVSTGRIAQIERVDGPAWERFCYVIAGSWYADDQLAPAPAQSASTLDRDPLSDIAPVPNHEPEIPPMADISNKLTPSPAVATGDMATRAFTRGAETAAAAEANEQLVAIFKRNMGPLWPPFFDTEPGKALAHALIPLGLHYAASTGKLPIPHTDAVKTGCEMALEAASRDLLQPYIGAILSAAQEFAGKVAK